MNVSVEQLFATEALPRNLEPADGYFGTFFQMMRQSLVAGGSEFGLSLTLFSLAVSIRAANVVEIGRFKGLSTLALAGALKFNDVGWDEPRQHKQRPDVDYAAFESARARRVISIDPHPTEEAARLIARAGLASYVAFVDHRSDAVQLEGEIDLLFIDGDHSYEGCASDVVRFVPFVRPGGYFILHDYFGWYDSNGVNNSPIKKVIDEIPRDRFQQVLVDTGYQSFTIFHRPRPDGAPR
jgi:hypothetical protein